jgi:hypothetical protein
VNLLGIEPHRAYFTGIVFLPCRVGDTILVFLPRKVGDTALHELSLRGWTPVDGFQRGSGGRGILLSLRFQYGV